MAGMFKTIRGRMLLIPGATLAVMLGVQFINEKINRDLLRDHVLPQFEEQVMHGHRNELKTAVDVEATLLAQLVAPLKTREQRAEAITAQTDPLRFMTDGSGYFFTYFMDGTRINIPTNKSLNGKKTQDMKDPDGVYFIKEFEKAATAGGGFVAYRFEKVGQGVQPKLSYVKPVAGTDIYVGAGVYTDDVKEESAKLQAGVAAASMQALKLRLVLLASAVTLVVGASWMIGRSIVKRLARGANALAAGSEQTSAAAGQIATASQTLAQGASEQAASITETTSAVEQLATTTKSNAGAVTRARGMSEEVRRATVAGDASMKRMDEAIRKIESSAHETAKISRAINDIAFQTNLLALNAAVEAARAGEAGKGFAVVAEEVRNLAMRSAEAAANTTELLEEAAGSAKQGVEIAGEVVGAFAAIENQTKSMGAVIEEIASAADVQAAGIEQISSAMEQMDKVTQSNAASAEETAAAAEELASQTTEVDRTVTDLRLLVGEKVRNSPRKGERQAVAAARSVK
ncbi:MAG: methyl-accepting chemotaxis protein [Phycisphaerae bacterium]